MDQSVDLVRLQRLSLDASQHIHCVLGFEKGKMMPSFELREDPGWNRQNLVDRPHLTSQAEKRRDEVSQDLCVERIAGDSDTRIAHDIRRGPPATANRGADANQGKVAGAASEVSNQNQ